MHFGDALVKMREGQAVARQGWNGAGMFAFITRIETSPAAQMMMERMGKPKTVSTRESLMLFTAQEDLAVWTPSGSDVLARDWEVVPKAFEHPIDAGHQCPSCGIGILQLDDAFKEFTRCPTCLNTFPF